MKQFLLFLSCFFFTNSILTAQDNIPQMMWGDIKNTDLQQKEWHSDTSVSAFVLGDVGNISMQFVDDYSGFHFKEFRRLKILNKEGFSYAHIEIPYLSKDETQKIVRIRAQTIAPNGDKFPLDSTQIAYKQLNDSWSVAEFTFPELTEGCIVEYTYEIHSTRSFELHEWYFQDKIPTRFSVLNLDILSRYEYLHLIQGKENLFVTPPRNDAASNRVFTTYYAKDLPGLKDDSYVSNIQNYRTRIRFQLANYKGMNSVKHEIITNWEKTGVDLLQNDNFGQKYLKVANYSQILEVAKKSYNNRDSQKEKAQNLYDFVNKNIRWDDTYNLLSAITPNEVWQNRKGNGSDINLTLLALLKDAGFKAYPILISTQEHGKVTPEYPVIDQFDHVLVYVEINNEQPLILDAGDAMRPLGMFRESSSNGKGWLLEDSKQTWVEIKPKSNFQTLVAKFDLSENGRLTGIIATNFRNSLAAQHRNTYNLASTTPEKGRIAYLTDKFENLQIDDLTSSNFEKKNESLKEIISCTVLPDAQPQKNIITFTPTLKSAWDTNPFKLINRSYPVEFASPLGEQYVATITLPLGYKVEELPKDLTLNLSADAVTFSYQITNENDNIIKLIVLLEIKKTLFLPAEYTELKDFFRQVAFKLKQKVVLKKIQP